MGLLNEDILFANKRVALLAILAANNDTVTKVAQMEEILAQIGITADDHNRMFNLESNMSNYSASPLINTAKYLGMDFIVTLEDIESPV